MQMKTASTISHRFYLN